MSDVELSVIIPTLGRDTLLKTVESLITRNFSDKIEVIVVGKLENSKVADGIKTSQSQFKRLTHLSLSFEHGDSSNKKNAGFEQSIARYVAFVDDDVIVGEDWGNRIITAFDDPGVGMVSGPSLIPGREDLGLMPRLASYVLASKAAGYVSERYQEGPVPHKEIIWSGVIGCNMAFRREVLEEVGGFDTRFWPGEEMLCSFQVQKKGSKIVFDSRASLYHYPRATLGGFIKQVFGYGITRIRLIREGVDVEYSTLIPAAWVLSLVMFGVGACFSTIALYLLFANLGLYMAFTLIITIMKFIETREAVTLLVLFFTPLVHISYGIGEWVECVCPNRDLSENSLKDKGVE